MRVRGDGRLDLVRVCGQWHRGFAKEGVGDIDKDVSYNHVLWFFDKTQMNAIYCVSKIIPSFYVDKSKWHTIISIYPIKKILKEKYVISKIYEFR